MMADLNSKLTFEAQDSSPAAPFHVRSCSNPDCGLTKPLPEFYKKGDRIDSQCKSCVSKKKALKYVDKKKRVVAFEKTSKKSVTVNKVLDLSACEILQTYDERDDEKIISAIKQYVETVASLDTRLKGEDET